MKLEYKDKVINKLFKKYRIKKDDQDYIISIINPIFCHPEFQKRLSKKFLHHDKTTLGYHILEDTIVTFRLAKRKKLSNSQMSLALKIAMMHDLYVMPWQNNELAKKNKLFNKHGFRHPIEAVVNAITWFPEFFEDDEEAKIIIDGVIHHMFPFPVVSINNNNYADIELNNLHEFNELDSKYKKYIYESCSKSKLGKLSFARTKHVEGKLMSKADKLSSLDNFSSVCGILALLTGVNPHIYKCF